MRIRQKTVIEQMDTAKRIEETAAALERSTGKSVNHRCPECNAVMSYESDYNGDGVQTQPPWWECACGYRERA